MFTDLKKKKEKSSFYPRVTNEFVVSLRLTMVKIRQFWGQYAEARTSLGLTLVNLSHGKTKVADFHCSSSSVYSAWGKNAQLP